MNIYRNEIRTGILVVFSLLALVALLVYLGAPGVFVPQHTYWIFFDNAAGIKPGAQVLLAGRKIGQVRELFSPVPEGNRPSPKLETLIEVEVNARAQVFNRVKVQITQPNLLGDSVIDFTSGEEGSGLAKNGAHFIGERAVSLSEIAPAVMEKLDPVLKELTGTLGSLEKTSDNLTKMTANGADLPMAFSEFKQFGTNLNEMTAYGGSLRKSLQNIEDMTGENGKLGLTLKQIAELTGPDSSLSRTFRNAEKFTGDLTEKNDAAATMRNLRQTSEELNRSLTQIGQQFTVIGGNLEQASDTVKHQPWRLIWPTTKKYPSTPTPSPTPKGRGARTR